MPGLWTRVRAPGAPRHLLEWCLLVLAACALPRLSGARLLVAGVPRRWSGEMTPCAPTQHAVRLILMEHEGTSYYIGECERCMSMVEIPSGICLACKAPMDNHRFYLSDEPVCPVPAKK